MILWTHPRFSSGTEQFIDLRGTGGPDVGIDNSNCTGMEERLVDCSFSQEVSDCNSNAHKVGVKCHEESKSLKVAVSSTQACYVHKLMNPLAVLGICVTFFFYLYGASDIQALSIACFCHSNLSSGLLGMHVNYYAMVTPGFYLHWS